MCFKPVAPEGEVLVVGELCVAAVVFSEEVRPRGSGCQWGLEVGECRIGSQVFSQTGCE